MLAILVPLVFLLVLLMELGSTANAEPSSKLWQSRVPVAASILALIILPISETLNLPGWIDPVHMAAAWGLTAAIAAMIGWRGGYFSRGWPRLARIMRSGIGGRRDTGMRPVIGMTPWPTRIKNVFRADPSEILLAQSPEIRDEYEEVAVRITGRGCRRVGPSTTRDDLEYTIRHLLGAPKSRVKIRHIRAPEPRRYAEGSPAPCAVICTACQDMMPQAELAVEVDYGHIRLFLHR